MPGTRPGRRGYGTAQGKFKREVGCLRPHRPLRRQGRDPATRVPTSARCRPAGPYSPTCDAHSIGVMLLSAKTCEMLKPAGVTVSYAAGVVCGTAFSS